MSGTISQHIARALGGLRMGAGWMARCPAHEDSTPSLSISETRDGKLLVYCHAGCSQDAVTAALRELGPWHLDEGGHGRRRRSTRAGCESAGGLDMRQRIAQALQPWCEARPADESVVESYLRSRGIALPLPRTLRHHPQLVHRSGTTWSAMLGLVTVGEGDQPVGIHRTWLARDGHGKAPVAPNKMMLGPCRGGSVRLAPASNPLMIGEGIETCLSAMQATGHATWAALSTSGMRALILPTSIRDIILLVDGDAPGESAARAAAVKWASEGRKVRIARAPHGMDFNDLLTSGLAAGADDE